MTHLPTIEEVIEKEKKDWKDNSPEPRIHGDNKTNTQRVWDNIQAYDRLRSWLWNIIKQAKGGNLDRISHTPWTAEEIQGLEKAKAMAEYSFCTLHDSLVDAAEEDEAEAKARQDAVPPVGGSKLLSRWMNEDESRIEDEELAVAEDLTTAVRKAKAAGMPPDCMDFLVREARKA